LPLTYRFNDLGTCGLVAVVVLVTWRIDLSKDMLVYNFVEFIRPCLSFDLRWKYTRLTINTHVFVRFDSYSGVVGDHASPSLLKDPSEASDCETLLGTGHNRTVQVVVADALGASATGTVGVWVQQQLLTQAEAETK
jgi:hypothetical protein